MKQKLYPEEHRKLKQTIRSWLLWALGLCGASAIITSLSMGDSGNEHWIVSLIKLVLVLGPLLVYPFIGYGYPNSYCEAVNGQLEGRFIWLWLGALITGGIGAGLYLLAEEHDLLWLGTMAVYVGQITVGIIIGIMLVSRHRCPACEGYDSYAQVKIDEAFMGTDFYTQVTRTLDHNVVKGKYGVNTTTTSNTITEWDRPAFGFDTDFEGVRGEAVYKVQEQQIQRDRYRDTVQIYCKYCHKTLGYKDRERSEYTNIGQATTSTQRQDIHFN